MREKWVSPKVSGFNFSEVKRGEVGNKGEKRGLNESAFAACLTAYGGRGGRRLNFLFLLWCCDWLNWKGRIERVGEKTFKKGKWQLQKRRHFFFTRVYKMKPYKMSPFPRFCSKLAGRYFAPPVTQGNKKKETQGGERSNVCCLHSLFDARRNSKTLNFPIFHIENTALFPFHPDSDAR